MITLLLAIVVVGFVVWFVQTYVPMQPAFKTAVTGIAVLLLVVYALSVFGLINAPALR